MNRDDEIYRKIYRNIKAYNVSVTDKFLDTCSNERLIRMSHPLQRDEFAKLLLGTKWKETEEYLPNLDEQDKSKNNELDNLG